ncbi:MAG: UDP-N-acetylmuramoyl-L-alanyl-D-glutamate--2,6-diaminopimelate ligase [Gammaproteobacteria bacterium]|nr:UDP-N-acetylmuramoyl-L-alanyl-D-glutamate--2,6-diaminopimelate ligase [Gammaproteobacteria bacterium]
MLLRELLSAVCASEDRAGIVFDHPVAGLAMDSREVHPGYVFLACQGTRVHGKAYIDKALKNGAIAVLVDAPETARVPARCIAVPDLSRRTGEIAARFYQTPGRDMRVIGVTGTNGKTSVTHAIAKVLHEHSPTGLIGTLGYGLYGALRAGKHTTPDAIRLQALFARLRAQNARNVVMEVSSHALVQERVSGIGFDIAVFTNLSRDHLDYHRTMQAYGEAKLRLFTAAGLKKAVVNRDDAFGRQLIKRLSADLEILTYSLRDTRADVYCREIQTRPQGFAATIESPWGAGLLRCPLLGGFNLGNLLAALTVLLNMGLPLEGILRSLGAIRAVPGRMECFARAGKPAVAVDYAHTPDALEQALLALRTHCNGDLYCVFGCGGERDKGKRPLMGRIAEQHADKVIITDDNPRHEASAAIIADIMQGIKHPAAVEIIANREQAIARAIQNAHNGDLILVAGKGHENYQQIGDEFATFDDRILAERLLAD